MSIFQNFQRIGTNNCAHFWNLIVSERMKTKQYQKKEIWCKEGKVAIARMCSYLVILKELFFTKAQPHKEGQLENFRIMNL